MQHNKEFLFDLSHYLTSVCIERAQLIIFQKEVVGVDSSLVLSQMLETKHFDPCILETKHLVYRICIETRIKLF